MVAIVTVTKGTQRAAWVGDTHMCSGLRYASSNAGVADGLATFSVWRGQIDHLAASHTTGDRIMVTGRLH
jgi:hypothetical protein